ncbi:major capsid protein [Gordonia phage Moosehead]|nr:major capsid protein [Gordonia phage Moosehead]
MNGRIKALTEAAQAAAKTARDIAEKAAAESREMNETEQHDYDTAMAKGRELLPQIETAKADQAVIDQAMGLANEIGPEAKGDLAGQDGTIPVRERVKSLGLQVVGSDEYKALMKGFPEGRIPDRASVKSNPVRVKGLFTGSSSTSGGAFVTNERTDIVEMLGRKTLTIRDLVSVRQTGSDTVEFVKQTSHTNAAAVVPEATSSAAPTAPGTAGALVLNANGGYKPEGSWAFDVETAVVKTIAEWVPATRRALADVAQLEGLINDELALDVKEAEENQILNGNGSGENFTGINNVSGVQAQAWATDLFTTTRKAITKARIAGRVNPTAWVLNPEDAEVLDLQKDGENRYYFGGPFAIANKTLWGIPVVESESQAAGTGLLGDFTKAVIWDREQTTITMTDSHADFFIRNMIAILAEERLAFGVTRPTAFVSVDLTA